MSKNRTPARTANARQILYQSRRGFCAALQTLAPAPHNGLTIFPSILPAAPPCGSSSSSSAIPPKKGSATGGPGMRFLFRSPLPLACFSRLATMRSSSE